MRDLRPLAQLTSLEQLYLFNTNVSDEEVDMLHKTLPSCRINFNGRKIADR